MNSHPPTVPVAYPAIERHGVIGDQRSAALVAADGTLDWLCLPDYDGGVAFGALLDHGGGGHWRLGPDRMALGTQDYRHRTATLITTWSAHGVRLEVADLMAGPGANPHGGPRAILRYLRCARGQARCCLDCTPRWDGAAAEASAAAAGEALFRVGPHRLRLWASGPVEVVAGGARATFELHEGEEFWTVLALEDRPANWSVERAQEVLAATERYWQRWINGLSYSGPRRRQVLRSAMLVHLLGHAPTGSLVAAPTTSLPRRIGGGGNVDHRFAWVRDAGLALAVLALTGNTEQGARHLDWLAGLGSATGAPLQAAYGIRGETDLPRHERRDVSGYRGSLPVRVGTDACRQEQPDALGYLLDGVHTYLGQGGRWRPEFWDVVRRCAEHVAAAWRRTGTGIWESPVPQHYLSGKVLSWVALDRAVRIAEQVGEAAGARRWRAARDAIHAEVMDRGWSDRLGAFRQRYEADTFDAAALLIPVTDFLPPDHPRVTATVEHVAERLSIDGLVHRFVPRETPGAGELPLGEAEGAFLPCTFWLATAYAKAGRPDEAEDVLRRAETVAGPLGLFAEGVDARSGTFLGNSPLLFSQAEYVRAALELVKAQPSPRNGAH